MLGAWLALAAVACAQAGPGPPEPPLQFAFPLYNLTVPENSPARTAAAAPPGAPPPGLRRPPGARLRFRIRHGDKDKLFKVEERCVGDYCFAVLRTRAGHDVLNRERRDRYRLQLRASAAGPAGRAEADTELDLLVTDVNDLSPLFYPTEYSVTAREDLPAAASVARVAADDADLGRAGEIYYSLAEPSDQFAVHPTSGVVWLTRPLRHAERARHELGVLAQDRAALLSRGAAAPAARARLTVHVARANLHAPEFSAQHLPTLPGAPAGLYAVLTVTDRDEGEAGRVAAVDIVDGDPHGHFRVRALPEPGQWAVLLHALRDPLAAPREYNLTIRARDAGRPPRASYLSLPARPAPRAAPAPVFSKQLYEVAVPETAPPHTPLVRLKVAERAGGAGGAAGGARTTIEIVGGNEGGEFLVHGESGVLYTAVRLDAERRAAYTLTVAAVDQGAAAARDQSSAKVQVTVLDANDNDPVFDPPALDVAVRENEPAGALVARVAARDADSGEAAYLSYSLADLQPVPFTVEHFTGAVRTARRLDYETMRHTWRLRVRASDWGQPHRRQAELALTVRVLDVNDNRPQWERASCAGPLPRRTPPGTPLATLSALDPDAGDVVSYRLAGGNDDGCFALDAASGALSLACDLRDARADTRVLNVTATDGTHFADATTVTFHLTAGGGGGALECRDTGAARRLTDLLAAAERANAPRDPADDFPALPSRYGDNLHSPEFVDFPVEVKVNESVALGTTLVTLKARDRDLGYNGLLVFAISDGDYDSAFRVDPATGALQLIGYLDREREAEYFLNVTVWDQGAPPRAASRLLPVTVLDVNDNKPVFARALASLRVTENAINGTAVFHAHATDADAGTFSDITYSVSGADDGEFCIEPKEGTLLVCAPLDRERRELYELTITATDGGGLRSEAIVRVSVDDINDVVPHFALPGYNARIREDVPVGTVVAVVDAIDPDLGAGGVLSYSLPDQSSDDLVFTIDETSGTLRTAKFLDYEERQVYGITVRATDGGLPALWAETTLIVEVLDVDENQHEPQFADFVLEGSVPEDAPRGTSVLTAAAKDADPPGRDSRLIYYVVGGSGMGYFSVDDAGVVRTLAPLDREAVPAYWLTICAEDHGLAPRHSCVQVYIEVTDVNDNAPWPQRALYSVTLPELAPGGTRVAQVTAEDLDDAGNVTYRILAGNPDGLFSIDEHTGTIVTTGRTLDREASPSHALEVQASDGELASSARVQVTVADINDHTPTFTQRFYQLRVPVTPGQQLGLPQGDAAADDELSTEADVESEDEDEGSGEKLAWDAFEEPAAGDVYVGTVLALDADAGLNGTVRYTGRARGGRALRVHATTGRLYAVSALKIGGVYDLTVRACDGGGRCGWARVAVRGAAPGAGAPPRLPTPPPLQVAELDAPGFLLALLQAEDDEGDTLYYDIVDGDARSEFYIGREDGSLVLARRLLWERQSLYTLNISVSDGLNTIYTPVNITVVNDLNEGGLTFSQEQYTIEVDEDTRVGAALAAVHAAPPGAGDRGVRVLYGLLAARAPASMPLFRLQELSGVLELAQPLDRETSSRHELTIWARDSAPRASRAYARLTVIVKDIDEHAPEWGRRLVEARVPSTAPIGSSIITLQATDRDVGENARITYSLAGGDASGSFEVDPLLGEVRLARDLPVGVKEYTLNVRAANPPPAARAATLPLHVTVVEPDNAPPVFTTPSITSEVYSDAAAGTSLAVAEARSSCSVQYALRGAEGRFRVNPAAGEISTAVSLHASKHGAKKEAPASQITYQFAVVATNMGGGTSEIPVTVHVLERNEYAPEFTQREYRGRISEAASPGALVSEQDSPEPLVLTTEDGDSSANQQKAFEVLDPDAAKVFNINPTTGAVILRENLDYETQPRYEFIVKVLDMGTPRLTSDSVATVVIDVMDVNDCAPKFPESTYSATILLPTAKDVLVLELLAIDADSIRGQTIKYDIIEGDEAGAFRLEQSGKLLVEKPDVLNEEYKLRVRASDGEYSSTTRVRVTVRTPEPAGLAFQKTDYYVSVVENSTKPVTVEVLNVLGAALNEHVEFKILNPVEGFQMGITSGAVTAGTIPLDREERSSYTLLISARSVGGTLGGTGGPGERVAHTRLHVSVTDVNDNCPVFLQRPYAAAVRAGDPPGTHVIRVHAVDADDNDNGEVRYEMKRGHGELFHVDRGSGLVTLKQTLDAHRQAYDLVIAAFDGGIRACGSEADVTVRVWAGGASPSWESPQITLQAKELYTGPLTPALRAVSPLQRQLIYTLLQPEDHPNFELQFDTGILVISSPLDYESARTHTLTVRATDGVTGAHADVGVTVEVTDVNDCAPEFTKDMYRASVSEAAAVGDLVVAVKATDNDTGLNGEIVYSITGDWNTSKPLFYMDGSGGVRVGAPLDRERAPAHHATVTAADRGNPRQLTTNHLFITVEDVNDNPPRMERSVISAIVSTEAARGTAVTAVSAYDPDSNDASKLRYAIASHDPHHTFSINSRTGVISLANPRAWEALAGASNSLSLNVSVSDGAHAVFARVKLSPAPANTKAPHFQHLLHEARALENQTPPLLLTTVKAYDEDAGEYGQVTYSIPSALLRETFSVDPRSGALTARVPLDRDTRAEWLVPITASDGGGLLRHTTVRVRVADVNDNAPVFPHREYRTSLRASRAPLAPFLTLTALDADEGDNAMIKYSIFDEEGTKGLFHVDEVTGALSLAKNVSHFVGRDVSLWIRATDGGGRTAEAPVTVSVLAPAGAAPAPSAPPPDLFLPEDAAPGTVIVELPAGEATYRLAEGLWSPELFEMDARGRLVLTGVLDRETAPLHRIGVISSTGALSSMWEVRLHVLDVNEHAPALHSQPYRALLAETAPPGTSVLQVMAEDPDAGSNGEVRFTIAEESESGALFTLDPYTGWLQTAAALDRETSPEHRLTVLATDGGSNRLVSRGTVVVRLKDYNDCPPQFSQPQYYAEVGEDAPPGTVVIKLEVTDPDLATTPLSFYISDGDPTSRFNIRSTGELIVAAELDREAVPTHLLTVLATDGKFSVTAQVTVNLTDYNDNPPYCLRHRYVSVISEDASVGSSLITVEASDDDEPQNARLRYYLTGDGAQDFAINKETGRVSVASPLDRERRPVYSLRAHVQDRDKPAWECVSELRLHVADVNDNAPAFSAARYSVTLPEDAELGTLVAKVHATDADLGPNRLLKYSLIDDGNGAFDLAEDSGIITLRAPLDRETASSHRLTVRAQDSGEPPRSATAVVLLTVADVNDNPPEFEFQRYSATVPEMDAVGTVIVRVMATSKDTGVNADVYYSIVGGDERADFTIDRASGAISIAKPLDYERNKEYILTVQAIDGGSPPLSDHATVNITVIDCNDNAPIFSQASYGARVKEDSPVGSNVLQVIALDEDAGENGRVQYSIARGNRDGRFSIDVDTGYISLIAPLDRETVPAYVIEVRAKDRGTPVMQASTTVNLEVLDANDNPPKFAQENYTCVVQEGRPLGHAVLELKVIDADAPPNAAPYTFDFQSGNEGGAFRLEQDGVLRTATRFNHRIKERYILQIRVFDNGTPPLYSDAWVTVRVIEESQYPPIVIPLEVVVMSYLDEFPGGILGRVHASDRDAYDTLTWTLSPTEGALYPATDLFDLDAKDGTLRAAPRLDVGDYKLNVTVSDGKFLSAASVHVSVVLVTNEMLAQSVVIRFREVTDTNFVLSHRKGFIRAVREAMDCVASDVVIISVQPSGDDVNELPRNKRQIAQDLDVLFAVRSGVDWASAEEIRRRLHAHLERLEELTRLVVEELVRAACGGCVRGQCVETAELGAGTRGAAADVFALVAPSHRLKASCVCPAGSEGDRCERQAAPKPPSCADCQTSVAYFDGESYALYQLSEATRTFEDELEVEVRVRTLAPAGTLLALIGKIDYLVLEIVDGYVQVRMELGSGPVEARTSASISDGAWHAVRVHRRGDTVRVSADRQHAAARVAPPAAVLDLPRQQMYVGAFMERHAHADAPLQVTRGFIGCISELRLGDTPLPLHGASPAGPLTRTVRVRNVPQCPALPPPTPCAEYPCLNGGTCTDNPTSTPAYSCGCHARYTGVHCEVDRAPCAGRPCLHGGHCTPADTERGYLCACTEPAYGDRCEKGKFCFGDNVCDNGGTCEEGAFGPSCRCRGYWGARCQHDVDECAGEPCADGATCANEPGGYRCVCPPGRTGAHCGNPLTTGAVLAADNIASTPGVLWLWLRSAGWPLYAGAAALITLLLLLSLLPLLCRRKRHDTITKDVPLNSHLPEKLPTKMSNLVADRRERPASCACEPQALNNADTLRSYGSAGDELEGMPPDYLRNLNIDPPDRKPWSEQMHLHTFTDNKIYNDLKGAKSPCPPSPSGAVRAGRRRGGGGDLVGGYHWDCSDWCAASPALPAITEVTVGERRDSTSPSSGHRPRPPPEYDTSSGHGDDDTRYEFTDASAYLVHPDAYLPREDDTGGDRDDTLRARTLREPDAASLITMLEERNSLLDDDDRSTTSDASARLCEIEESDAEETTPLRDPGPVASLSPKRDSAPLGVAIRARQTDV